MNIIVHSKTEWHITILEIRPHISFFLYWYGALLASSFLGGGDGQNHGNSPPSVQLCQYLRLVNAVTTLLSYPVL